MPARAKRRASAAPRPEPAPTITAVALTSALLSDRNRNPSAGCPALLRLHTGFLCDLAPRIDVFLDEGAKGLGSSARRRHAIARELVLHILVLQNLVELAVQALEYRPGQVLGRDQPVPQDHLVAF